MSTAAGSGNPPGERAATGGRHDDVVTAVLEVIMRLAAGELTARVPLPEPLVEDDLSAIGVGINMLAEELQALRDGLERAVDERTAELRATQEQLQHDAGHDDLTGLANRRLLHQRVEHRLTRGADGSAMLLLDLDGFKTINDDLGHSIGDAVLVEVAARLRRCLRPEDTVARLGGDEFAALVGGLDDEGLQAVTERVHEQVAAPLTVEGFAVQVTASLGVVPARHASTAEELLRLADLAMYRAKADGGGRTCVYSVQLMDQARQRRHVEQGLRAAMERGGLAVVYQPQVDARSGALVGVEALARWPHASVPAYPPSVFIPVAEQTGLIRDIGAAVLERACRDAARWAQETGEALRFSVNVSGRQLTDPGFADLVLTTLARCGATTRMLGLEVTESLIVEQEEGIEALTRLREAGVQIAIDDFGTGYSSLSALRRLPVDVLKIDRSFVSGLGSDDDDGTIVRAVLALARGLRLSVVAEGVETVFQHRDLVAQGCQSLQGFLFARPMPYQELASWQDESGRRLRSGA